MPPKRDDDGPRPTPADARLSDERIRRILRSNYGLDAEVIGFIALETNSSGGHRLLADGQGLFLKPFASYQTEEQNLVTARAHLQLYRSCAPVPELIPTRLGAAHVTDDSFSGTLQRWLPGRQGRELDGPECLQALQVMREFERAARSVSPAPSATRLTPGLPDEPDQILTLASALAARVEHLTPQNRRKGALFLAAVREALDGVKWDSLPRSYNHGDPAPSNLLIHEDRIRFIDLDDGRWTYRLWDPLRLIAQYALFLPPGGPVADIRFSAALLGEAFEAFLKSAAPSAAERMSAAPLLRCTMLAIVASLTNLDWEILDFDPPARLNDAQGLSDTIDVLHGIFAQCPGH